LYVQIHQSMFLLFFNPCLNKIKYQIQDFIPKNGLKPESNNPNLILHLYRFNFYGKIFGVKING
jgi:hypothetical protein